jgi:competence protein ComEC
MKLFWWVFLLVILVIRIVTSTPNFIDGQVIKIGGAVMTEPAVSGRFLKFNLSGIGVSLSPDNDIHYGDSVTIIGTYKNGKLVDGQVVEKIIGNNIFVELRKQLTGFYLKSLRQPDAGLVAGITMGAKSSLSRSMSAKLVNSGTTHMVVASGTNVALVGEFLLTVLLLTINRRKAIVITIIAIWFYTLITGFEAPILRATIMATAAFIGQIFGRVSNTLRVTFITGLVMLFVVPMWIGDVGFWLSFTTTLSLIVFNTKVYKKLYFVPEFLREDLATTLSAQIASTPIIYAVFGNYNPMSVIYNILVIWTIPLIMIIGGVSGILSFFWIEGARVVLQLALPLTSWFVTIVGLSV